MKLTVPIAEAIVGGRLGQTSKMPCRSWGISAFACKRGDELANNLDTVCSQCYARRGQFMAPSPKRAHERRLDALAHPQWPDAMAYLINAYERGGYFRWFDSGDLQSSEHLEQIVRVAERTPSVRHWLPTHEPELVAAARATHRRNRRGAGPPNLVIRISADYIEDRPTTPTFGLPTSTVHRHPGEPVPFGKRNASIECRAYLWGEHCGSCRACWSPKVQNVSYLLNAGLRHSARRPIRLRGAR